MRYFYVYVTDRSIDGAFGQRLYANIYEANNKDEVKELLLSDIDWLPSVRQRITKSTPENEKFLTTIYEMNGYYLDVFMKERVCVSCLESFTKIQKMKFNAGGRAEFCSSECDTEYSKRFYPKSTDAYDNGFVYKITHISSGKFYVGVTTRWLMQRWWEHIKAESGSEFHKFIKEVDDVTQFTFQALESFRPSEVDPFVRESYWIERLNAVQNGFNSVGGHKVTKVEV